MRILIAAGLALLVAGTALATETITYSYDALGRLQTVVHSGTVNGGLQTTYVHDSADNRATVTTTGASH